MHDRHRANQANRPGGRMNARQLRACASIQTAVSCLNQLRTVPPPVIELREQLQAAGKRIRDASVAQYMGGTRLGARGTKISQLSDALRVQHLLPVCRRGRLLLKGLPGIEDALRVPHARDSDELLLAAAKRIASAVAPHAKAFRKAKFRSDFIKRLEAAAAALQAATAVPNVARTKRSLATIAVRDEISHAREIIAAIDSLIAAEFHGDPGVVARWRKAKRIGGRIGRPPKRRPPPGTR
jgi:hypothetical protein